MDILPGNKGGKQEAKQTAAENLAGHGAYAGTPGHKYIADWLAPDCDNAVDIHWLAGAINDGWFVACERCHFLYLPTPPFIIDPCHIKNGIEPLDACDVCINIPWELRFPNNVEDMDEMLAEAPANLITARVERAKILYDLWISGCTNAEALVWGEMGSALIPIRNAYTQKAGPNDQEDGGAPSLKMAA